MFFVQDGSECVNYPAGFQLAHALGPWSFLVAAQTPVEKPGPCMLLYFFSVDHGIKKPQGDATRLLCYPGVLCAAPQFLYFSLLHF